MTQPLDRPDLSFAEVIAQHGRNFAERICVACGDETLTWGEFDRATNRVANMLVELGVRAGDRVCLFMPTSLAAYQLLWGTVKAGAVTVPLNVMVSPEALTAFVQSAGARLLFADTHTTAVVESVRDSLTAIPEDGFCALDPATPGWLNAAELIAGASPEPPRVQPRMSDPMSIIFSSGTTGTPKGIEHSVYARMMYPLWFGLGMGIGRSATTLCATPLYTNGTWLLMLPTVYAGGTVVLLPKFSAEATFAAIERHRATHTFLVPTQSIMLLESGLAPQRDLSSLRVLMSGGQRLNAVTFDRLAETLPNVGLYEVYGMTEGFITLGTPEDWRDGKRGSVGVPIMGCDLRIIDAEGNELPSGEVGEIVAYSPGLMNGYYDARELTEEIIWRDVRGRTFIRSGDVGRVDGDGFVWVEGRIKDMIKSGGINIFASDIEEVFAGHPDVVEVAAIAVPHEKWVETPLLLVIPRSGATVTPDELMRWGNEQLGRFQRVSAVEFRSDFPRAAYNKVRKQELRAPYWTESS